MPKGSKCPACGQQTFHKSQAVHECSKCHAVGWWIEPDKPGAGKGHGCRLCGNQTCREIATYGRTSIWHCYTCKLTHATLRSMI